MHVIANSIVMRKLLVLIVCLVTTCVIAQIPNAISYQGILLNPTTAEPVANGQHTVKFRVYDAPTGGNFQWETSSIDVTTFKGLFTTIIPVPASATWNQALYVEVVANGVESGRIQLTTVPYAFRAGSAIAMDAAGLTGTINDSRLSTHLQDLADGTLSDSKLTVHLQDLADGSLSGSKIGEGISASNITTGTLPSTVMPSGSISGNGTVNQLAYWTGTNQMGSTGVTWEAAESELGVGTSTPRASVAISHGPSHPVGAALAIDNTWNLAGRKTGLDISLTSNSSGAAYGINAQLATGGTGERYGVSATSSSDATNSSTIYGIAGYADGQGTREHRGVYGKASATNASELAGVYGEATAASGTKYGVRGLATGAGPNNYGVYGSATNAFNNYGVYSNGHFHTVGNITFTGTSTQSSDRKLKRNIVALPPSLDKILQLKPSSYYFRTTEYARMNLAKGRQMGLIAQDVEKLFPELVSTQINAQEDDENGNTISPQFEYKAINYIALIPVLIKGMQEQQAMIDDLKKEIQQLKQERHNQPANGRVVKTSLK